MAAEKSLFKTTRRAPPQRLLLCRLIKKRVWTLVWLFIYLIIALLAATRYWHEREGVLLSNANSAKLLKKLNAVLLNSPLHTPNTIELQAAVQRQSNRQRSLSGPVWLWDVIKLLDTEGDVLKCETDDSLLSQDPEETGPLLIAINLRDSENLMPNLIIQLLKLISLYGKDQIRISIYESGSSDLTADWLLFFKKLLNLLLIEHQIVVHGSIVRDKYEDRIAFLAQLRNAALDTLHSWSSSWKAKRVVFINDVFFCTQHILRLLLHEADVACGMDFSSCLGCLPRRRQREIMKQDLQETFYLPRFLACYLSRFNWLLRKWRRSMPVKNRWTSRAPLVFYDIWATIDLRGRNFINPPPYTVDNTTKSLLLQGYPVYVHSCWNGIVALSAEPFYRNLRARCQFPEECQASECFFICHDFALLGYDRILIDPGVRVAYKFHQSRQLYNSSIVNKIPFRPWFVDGVVNPNMPHKPHPSSITCCVLGNGDQVNFERDCSLFDYSGLNCTLKALGLENRCFPMVSAVT